MEQRTLEFTGERMVPEAAKERTLWAHLYRYQFAATFVRGQATLDIASGEGYGTKALQSSGAAEVIGIDISEEACRHARAKYGIDARQGDAEHIELPDRSIDTLVSFETIEHVPRPERFINEIKRILRPSGLAIISTPNKEIYSQNQTNAFHCSELTLDEFIAMLHSAFRDIQLFIQAPTKAPRLSPLGLSTVNPWWCRFNTLKMFRSRLCRPFNPSVLRFARQCPVEEIMRPNGMVSNLLNPWIVRSAREPRLPAPTFFIAVCRHPLGAA